MAIREAFPDGKRLDRFTACGAGAWIVRHPTHSHDYRVMAPYCHDRFCVPCAAMRGRLLAANLLNALDDSPLRMITLTLRSEPGEPLRPLLDKLYQSFARLRRDPWWAKLVDGGCAMCEVKYIARTRRWHPHLHILAHGRYVPKDTLAALWLRITGDSWIVDVGLVRDHGKAAYYVTKYVSKPGDYSTMHSPALLTEMMLALKGRRLCSTFGAWRGIKLLAHDEPIDWQYVDTLSAIERKAHNGDADAIRIMRIVTATPASDEDPQPDLPWPDE